MSVNPIHGAAPVTQTQAPQPAPAPVQGDHDGDADDTAGAAKSSPQAHVGGLVDRDA